MTELATRDFGGEGAPVLLLHGAGAHLDAMAPLADALRAEHRVLAVDLPGHGHSPDADWDWDAARAAWSSGTESRSCGRIRAWRPNCVRVRVPLLLVLVTEDLPDQRPFHDLYAAHRSFVLARATDAAASNPLVTVEPLAGATHAMAMDRPAEIARLVGART